MSTAKKPGRVLPFSPSYILVKRCPDGRQININLNSEIELRKHLTAMWDCTPGYSVTAVISLPTGTFSTML